jgi:hypothetical protein
VVDITKDVFTYSDATRSRSRPARGGRRARAALGGGSYFRHALLQLSNLLREVEPEAALCAPHCEQGQPGGRTREEKRSNRLTIPRDAMPATPSYFRLLAMALPNWMIVGSY